jgi:hypothetical protein
MTFPRSPGNEVARLSAGPTASSLVELRLGVANACVMLIPCGIYLP